MEIFEVHITGDKSIHEVAAKHGHKTIAIENLTPNNEVLYVSHMTSLILKYDGEGNYVPTCMREVLRIAEAYADAGVGILRIKIESPIYTRYIDQALYMESHFESSDFVLPTSRNQKKQNLLATDRTYDRAEFGSFAEKYQGKELELCLFDSFVAEDKEWMRLWNK